MFHINLQIPFSIDVRIASDLPEYLEDRQIFKSEGNWTLKAFTNKDSEVALLKIFVTLCGTQNSSDSIQLLEESREDSLEANEEPKMQEFIPGQYNSFKFSVGNELGELIKLRFTTQFEEKAVTWNLEKFILKDDDTNMEFFSKCEKIIEVNHQKKFCIMEVGLSRPDIPPLIGM